MSLYWLSIVIVKTIYPNYGKYFSGAFYSVFGYLFCSHIYSQESLFKPISQIINKIETY